MITKAVNRNTYTHIYHICVGPEENEDEEEKQEHES